MRRCRHGAIFLLMLLVVATSATGAPGQACIGLPIGPQPTTALVELANHPDVTLYSGRVGRDLGRSLTGLVGYSRSTIRTADPGFSGDRRGSSQGIGGVLASNFAIEEIPLCTIVGLRHGRATTTYRSFQPGGVTVADRVTGTAALMGIGIGGDGRLSDDVSFTLFGNARMGLARSRFSNHCPVTGGCSYTTSESIVHMEAETGLLLRHGRFVGGGGARVTFSDSDPLLRLMSLYSLEPLLWFLTVGVMF